MKKKAFTWELQALMRGKSKNLGMIEQNVEREEWRNFEEADLLGDGEEVKFWELLVPSSPSLIPRGSRNKESTTRRGDFPP